jgi:hypothetical protein
MTRTFAVIAALLLAGCGGAGTGKQADEAAPAGNAGAARADAPAAEPAVLTAEGFGPLRIGMSRAEVVKALGEDSDPEGVGGPDPESCDMFRPLRAPEGMLVMIEEGRLTSISLIEGSKVATDRGLRLGARRPLRSAPPMARRSGRSPTNMRRLRPNISPSGRRTRRAGRRTRRRPAPAASTTRSAATASSRRSMPAGRASNMWRAAPERLTWI